MPAPPRRPWRDGDCCGSCLRATPLELGARRRDCPRSAGSRCCANHSSNSLRLESRRQGEVELAAPAGRGFDPDAAAMVLDHLFDDGEADAGARILVALVQALEDQEYALKIFLLDADAVILDQEVPEFFLGRGGNADEGSFAVAAELERVADHVLEQLVDLGTVGGDLRKRPALDRVAAFGYLALQIGEHGLQRVGGPEIFRISALAPDTGIAQQIVDQALHTIGAFNGEADELVGVAVELVLVAALQQLAIARHHAQRLLQIVRGHIGELLEFGVGALQFGGVLFDFARLQPDGLLGRAQFRDIADRAGVAHGLAVLVADRDGLAVDDAYLAVGADDPVFVGLDGLARPYVLARLEADAPVVGMDQAEKIVVGRDEALAADAEDFESRIRPLALVGDQIPVVAAGA